MKIGGQIASFLKAVYMDASIEVKVGEVHSKLFRVAYMWSTYAKVAFSHHCYSRFTLLTGHKIEVGRGWAESFWEWGGFIH